MYTCERERLGWKGKWKRSDEFCRAGLPSLKSKQYLGGKAIKCDVKGGQLPNPLYYLYYLSKYTN